jgi:hypothetical protein
MGCGSDDWTIESPLPGVRRHQIPRQLPSQIQIRDTLTHHGHRSTLKRMAGMSSHRKWRAPASHSIIALLTENSASSPMTSFISIHKY